MFAGIHRHLLFTLVGAGIGTFAGVVEKERYGKRDFYIDDYIKRNPDDFVKGEITNSKLSIILQVTFQIMKVQ